MIDISEKIETLRSAIAATEVRARQETIERAWRGETPKGEVLVVARAAGVLAAKKTPELIPYCHPLALDKVAIHFEKGEGRIAVRAEVVAIGRTGVEMEALTAAAVAALTVYDMVKGIDKDVTLGETRLLEKRGGKSDFVESFPVPLKAAVLVTSDSVSAGKKGDKSGKRICEAMAKFPVEVLSYEVIPDDRDKIRARLLEYVERGLDLVLSTGGTGLGPRDVTAEVVREIAEREIPGIGEAMRVYGQRRTPYAMLSRGLAAQRGKTLLLTLPGSSNGVKESIAALFPNVLHAFNMMRGGGH
ncbi:bifunctional molybdenum cofactor biosynthesis protein MoaC/MoaB [Deltaproteobacteria bacterium PRO3]|nr:bifunctional molybdenum cofactor biosynthesis protein MoaC/MoaB [Deltaproteobacteria bacterium PRO3]